MLTNLSLPNGVVLNETQTLLGAGQLFTTGKVLYVSSLGGNNINVGNDPAAPIATVAQAISQCRANKGDIIVILPGHTETVTATSINVNVAGVTIVGLGSG